MTMTSETAVTVRSDDSIPLPSAPATDPPPRPTWEDFAALEQRLEQRAIRFTNLTLFIWVFAAVSVIISLIGIGFGFRAIDDAKHAAAGNAPAAAPVIASSPGSVTLSDFKVTAAATNVSAGNATIQISNAGSVQHELLVFRSDLPPSAYPLKDGNIDEEGAGITKVSDGDNLGPATTQTRAVDLTQPGTYLFVCNLPGHFKAGMYQIVTVK
jgi:uncharacterized cupredoxin-like copper-binding protein